MINTPVSLNVLPVVFHLLRSQYRVLRLRRNVLMTSPMQHALTISITRSRFCRTRHRCNEVAVNSNSRIHVFVVARSSADPFPRPPYCHTRNTVRVMIRRVFTNPNVGICVTLLVCWGPARTECCSVHARREPRPIGTRDSNNRTIR